MAIYEDLVLISDYSADILICNIVTAWVEPNKITMVILQDDLGEEVWIFRAPSMFYSTMIWFIIVHYEVCI